MEKKSPGGWDNSPGGGGGEIIHYHQGPNPCIPGTIYIYFQFPLITFFHRHPFSFVVCPGTPSESQRESLPLRFCLWGVSSPANRGGKALRQGGLDAKKWPDDSFYIYWMTNGVYY